MEGKINKYYSSYWLNDTMGVEVIFIKLETPQMIIIGTQK